MLAWISIIMVVIGILLSFIFIYLLEYIKHFVLAFTCSLTLVIAGVVVATFVPFQPITYEVIEVIPYTSEDRENYYLFYLENGNQVTKVFLSEEEKIEYYRNEEFIITPHKLNELKQD